MSPYQTRRQWRRVIVGVVFVGGFLGVLAQVFSRSFADVSVFWPLGAVLAWILCEYLDIQFPVGGAKDPDD